MYSKSDLKFHVAEHLVSISWLIGSRVSTFHTGNRSRFVVGCVAAMYEWLCGFKADCIQDVCLAASSHDFRINPD